MVPEGESKNLNGTKIPLLSYNTHTHTKHANTTHTWSIVKNLSSQRGKREKAEGRATERKRRGEQKINHT